MADLTRNLIALPSAARTVSENSADLKNVAFVGCQAVIDMSAETVEGTVTLDTGASGSVDGITVNGVEIMSGAESFDTSLTVTATNVAANITANTSSPDYTAIAVGAVITITSIIGGDTFVVVSSATTITTTDVNMASAGSVVFKIQAKDELSGQYYDLVESAAIVTISTVVLRVYPGLTAVANLTATDNLPMDFRVVATHTGAFTMTYSVGINLLK